MWNKLNKWIAAHTKWAEHEAVRILIENMIGIGLATFMAEIAKAAIFGHGG